MRSTARRFCAPARGALVLGIAILGILCLHSNLDAQILYGTLVGNVTDATGAAIPGARVAITNTDTAQEWELTTGATGVYSIATIPPGTYSVSVSSEGFRTFTKSGIAVTAGSTVRADVRLDSVDVRYEVESDVLENVPLPVTRNFQNMLITIPGIAPPRRAHSLSANPSRALGLNANGTTAQSVAVRVDGATTWHSWLPHGTRGYHTFPGTSHRWRRLRT